MTEKKISEHDMNQEMHEFLSRLKEINEDTISILDYRFTLKDVISFFAQKGAITRVEPIPEVLIDSFTNRNREDLEDNIRALSYQVLQCCADSLISIAKKNDIKEQNGYKIMK